MLQYFIAYGELDLMANCFIAYGEKEIGVGEKMIAYGDKRMKNEAVS